MKKKVLTEEIIRIQKMMGVPTKLIMEAGPGGPIAEKGAKELWATIEKLFTRELERGTEEGLEKTLERLESVVGRENVEALERIIKGTEKLETKKANIIDSLAKDKIVQQAITARLEEDANYAAELVKLYDKFIRDIDVRKYLDDMYTYALGRAGGDVEYANKMMRDVLGEEIGMKELDRYLTTVKVTELRGGGFEIKLKDEINSEPFLPPNPTEDTAGNGEGIFNYLLKNLKKTPKNVVETVKGMISDTNLADLQDMIAIFRRMFKNIRDLEAEFAEVIETILDKTVKERNSSNFGKEYSQDVLKASQIVGSINGFVSKVPKTFVKEWMKTLKNKYKDKKNGLLVIQELDRIIREVETSDRTKDIWDAAMKQKRVWDAMRLETNAIKEANPFRLNPFQKGPGFLFIRNPKEINWARLRNFVIIMDGRTLKEWKRAMIIRGAGPDLLANLAFRYFSHAVVVPVLVETLVWSFRTTTAVVEDLINRLPFKDVNLVDYNEEKLPIDEYYLEILKKEWLDNIRKNLPEFFEIPGEILGQFTGGKESGKEWYSGLKHFAEENSYIDDIFDSVIKPWIAGKSRFTDEDEKKLKDAFEKYKEKGFDGWEKYKSTLKGKDLEAAEALEKGREILQDIKVGDTEPWFTAWCVKNGKNKQEWVSSINGNYGTTTDGIKWKYNINSKGFDKVEETTGDLTNNTGKINDSEEGFKYWCETQNPKRIYIEKSYSNGVGTTKESDKSLDWQWNGSTFKQYGQPY